MADEKSDNLRVFLVSLGITIIISVILFNIKDIIQLDAWRENVSYNFYGFLSQMYGGLLGFIITAISIIIAFPETESIKLLKMSNHYKLILDSYKDLIKSLAISTFTGILSMILYYQWVGWLVLTIFFLSFNSIKIYRCLWIFCKLIEIVSKDARVKAKNS